MPGGLHAHDLRGCRVADDQLPARVDDQEADGQHVHHLLEAVTLGRRFGQRPITRADHLLGLTQELIIVTQNMEHGLTSERRGIIEVMQVGHNVEHGAALLVALAQTQLQQRHLLAQTRLRREACLVIHLLRLLRLPVDHDLRGLTDH